MSPEEREYQARGFGLATRDKKPVLMRDGRPFRYSSADLAKRGARYLETEHGTALYVTSAA